MQRAAKRLMQTGAAFAANRTATSKGRVEFRSHKREDVDAMLDTLFEDPVR